MTSSDGFEALRYEKKNQVACIWICRPKVLNALNGQALGELARAFRLVGEDEQVRAAILTGEGDKAFAAGADIGEFAALNPAQALELSRRGQALCALIEGCGKPVIAAVNGFALGGGCELALACTLRLAAEQARFGQPEVKLGIIPGYGGSQRLARLVGKGAALQLILTGEMISAAEALRIGLVNEVLPAAELLPRAWRVAEQMVANAPLALRYALAAVHEGAEMPLPQALEHEAALFALSFATQDCREGVAAFLEKRAARFGGL